MLGTTGLVRDWIDTTRFFRLPIPKRASSLRVIARTHPEGRLVCRR